MAARVRQISRAIVAAAVGAALVASGCGVAARNAPPVTFPPQSFGPAQTIGPAGNATLSAVSAALGARSLQVQAPQIPFRPAEAGSFAAAPRAVLQVVLPEDPDHGFISVYQFPDAAAAAQAAAEQATYLASGPGRVQFPLDTRFVLRRLGATVVFYAWSPATSPDRRTSGIQDALETLGTRVDVPR